MQEQHADAQPHAPCPPLPPRVEGSSSSAPVIYASTSAPIPVPASAPQPRRASPSLSPPLPPARPAQTQTTGPALEMDIDSLLEGLGAEDFDYDEFDDDTGLSQSGATVPPAPSTPSRPPPHTAPFPSPTRTPSPPRFPGSTPSPPPAEIPALVSFATGRGRPLPRPSDAALKRAHKLMDAVEEEMGLGPAGDEEPPEARSQREGSAKKRPRLSAESASERGDGALSSSPRLNTPRVTAQPFPHDAFVTPLPPTRRTSDADADAGGRLPSPPSLGFQGFRLASGGSAPPVSAASRARALALFDSQPELSASASTSPIRSPPPVSTGFQIASGGNPPPVSAASRARALALFDSQPEASASLTTGDPAQTISGTPLPSGSAAPAMSSSCAEALALFGEDLPSLPTPPPGFKLGFQMGSGRALPAPSAESLARARALLEEPSSSPISAEERDSGLPPVPERAPPPTQTQTPTPFRPLLPSSTPRRPGSPAFSRPGNLGVRPPTTPSRIPLRPMPENALANNTRSQGGPASSTPASVKLPRRVDIKTPVAGTPRRIGLGIGLRTTPVGRKGPAKGFVTPFKTPDAARVTAAASGSQPITTPTGVRARLAPPPKPERIWEPVFDLQPRPHRVSMRDAKLHPGLYSSADLASMGYPDEIWLLNMKNAIYYQFIGEDASVLGNAQALARLKFEGCALATAKWVDNHWPLILWKLAGQVRAKPSLYEEKWNWYEVLCQLKYRYEREFGAGQRPLVRRIQEHDSAPGLPMVLCVANIYRPSPVRAEDKDEPVPQRPFLDLTDGWYHIRALTDACLARAIDKGKIVIGRKLAIAGAKLESGTDGAPVLDAYETSHLVLSGNSTHLARWDARLGAQPHPFVAGLSSLSGDGGTIVFMDIVLTKLYPLAFVDSEPGSRTGPWNEDEEHMRADAWQEKYDAESLRLGNEMRHRLEKIEDVADTLASAAVDAGAARVGMGSPPDTLDVDGEFETLLEARPGAALARIRGLPAVAVVHLAQYARQRVAQSTAEARAELEAELRTICPPRSVRDFRVVRFADAQRGCKEPVRTGLLQIWDARALGTSITEGRRFRVSNLVPGRNGDWSRPRAGTVKEVYLHTRRDTRWQPVGME